VHAVLRHLEAVGFTGAPRVLGFDEQGREVLTYIEGRVISNAGELSEDQLRSAAGLLRRFHDATADTELAGDGEVVLHGDVGPHNTVFNGDRAVGLIDWDEYVGAGQRTQVVGHAVWCFADIGKTGGALSVQAHRARVFCEAYGWTKPALVIDEITDRFHRARADHRAAGRDEAAVIFGELITWMERFGPALKSHM
jgi:aminoglycoside phosphotransferase (APT) family kinase protein